MTTRPFAQAGRDVQGLTQDLGSLTSTVTRTILPVLGLTAVLGLASGGFNDATSSGRVMSSAMFEAQVSMYGVQEAITRAVLPAVEAVIPAITQVADAFTAADEATGGWSTRLGLAGVAAFALRRHPALLAAGAAVAANAAGAEAAEGSPFGFLFRAPIRTPAEDVIRGFAGLGPVPESGSQAQPQPQSGSQAQPQPQSGSQAQPQPQSGSQAQPQPQSGSQAQPQPQSGSQAQPQPQSGGHSNNITIYANNSEEALRQVQEWLDQGALRVD